MKLVIEIGELDRESERDLEGERLGDGDLERLRSERFVSRLGDPERDLLLLRSSSGDSLRNRLRIGLRVPFCDVLPMESSRPELMGDGGGEDSRIPCSISSSFVFFACALFL